MLRHWPVRGTGTKEDDNHGERLHRWQGTYTADDRRGTGVLPEAAGTGTAEVSLAVPGKEARTRMHTVCVRKEDPV